MGRGSRSFDVALTLPLAARAPARLSIDRLALTGFRGYARLRLNLGPEPVVLTGPNGAGKTNLLEAVSFLSPGRGLRGTHLSDALCDRADIEPAPTAWSIGASVSTQHGSVELATGWPLPGGAKPGSERRMVRIDGRLAGGQAALAEHVSLVWLTPAMDRLFVEGAAGRRRFLDRLVFALDPAHAGRTLAFERSRRARAKLLAEGRFDEAWLGAIEHDMAERAVAIAAARLDLIGRLEGAIIEAETPFPKPALALDGLIEGWLSDAPALEAEERYRCHLAAMRRRDAEVETCDGPQRSDLVVSFEAGGRAAEHCSTGEQKALLIALVLAHARLITRLKGAAPILLLDEVAAHLDEGRRATLFDEILALGCQAWMTGTETQPFALLKSAARFLAVRQADVTEESVHG